MQYPNRRNFKGLLAIRDDKTVDHATQAYSAVQRVMSIFDASAQRMGAFAGTTSGASEGNSYSVFAYRTPGGPIVTLWRDSHRPGERPQVERLGLALPGLQFTQPVWVDLLSGKVYAISASQWSQSQDAAVFRGVPAYDSVVLIAEQKAIPLASAQ
jgi:hypothetical protein